MPLKIKSDLNGTIIVPQAILDILVKDLESTGILDELVGQDEAYLTSLLQASEELVIQWFFQECLPRLPEFFDQYPIVPEDVAEFVHDMVTGFVPPHGGFPFSQKTEVRLENKTIRIYTFEWLPASGEEKHWKPHQLIVELDSGCP